MNAAVTLFLRFLPFVDCSSLTIGDGVGVCAVKSFVEFRCEFVDGVLINVITKRSSIDCVVVDFLLDKEIFKNEEKFDFELVDVANDDVDEDGDGIYEIDLTIMMWGNNNLHAD